MPVPIQTALAKLRENEAELQSKGVRHAAVFGSTARGEAHAHSDIDILIELDPARPIGLFEYSRLKLDIADLFDGRADIVNRETLRPLLRDSILADAVNAF